MPSITTRPPVSIAEHVGAWIRAKRQGLRLSQGDLAKLLSTTQPVVSRWEVGASMPQLDSFVQICGALKQVPAVGIDEILRAHAANVTLGPLFAENPDWLRG